MEGCYFATLPCIRCVLRGIWLGYTVRSPPTNSILPQRLGYLQPTRGNLRWVFTCNATSLLTLISWEIPTYVAHPQPAVSNKIRSSWIVQDLSKDTSPDTAKSSSVPDRDFNPSTKEKINFSLKFEEKIPSTEAQTPAAGRAWRPFWPDRTQVQLPPGPDPGLFGDPQPAQGARWPDPGLLRDPQPARGDRIWSPRRGRWLIHNNHSNPLALTES